MVLLWVERMVNPVTVRFKLPASLKVHPMFHVSRVKPMGESNLFPVTDNLPAVWTIDGALTDTVHQILDIR